MTTQNAFTIPISTGRLVKVAAIAAIITLNAVSADAQKLHKISLEKFKIDNEEINFTVSEVLDARKEKNSLGVVQSGLTNKPNFAVFEKPGLGEIEKLLENSGLHSETNGLSLRINTIKISEVSTIWKETAKAELSIDFFVTYENRYYYITSVFVSAEPKGIETTKEHPENIVTVIEKAFISYSNKKNEADPARAFTKDELLDPSLSLRDPMSMPILRDEKFNDGYYASFEEFVNNQPSIPIDCEVNFSDPVEVLCGEKSTELSTLFGFAHDNKLFILFHHQFFELKKRKDTFYFNGPAKITAAHKQNLRSGFFGPALLAATILMDHGTYSELYVLSMETGVVKSLTGL